MALTLLRTKDGDPAVRFAHLALAMLPAPASSTHAFRVCSAYPPRDPTLCSRDDFVGGSTWVDDEAAFLAHAQGLADHYDEATRLGRQEIFRQIPTPWDTSQTRTRYYEGIESVSCAGHGGFLLSPAMNELVDEAWRASNGAYEEDECWAIVAFTFPHLFTQYEMKHANRTLKNSFPEVYERLTGSIIPLEESETKRRRAFYTAHANDFIVTSASYSKTDRTKLICSAAIGGRGADEYKLPTTTTFIVDASEYNTNRSSYGFIIDQARHPRVDHEGNPQLLPSLC